MPLSYRPDTTAISPALCFQVYELIPRIDGFYDAISECLELIADILRCKMEGTLYYRDSDDPCYMTQSYRPAPV
jgi:hypothetical protein